MNRFTLMQNLNINVRYLFGPLDESIYLIEEYYTLSSPQEKTTTLFLNRGIVIFISVCFVLHQLVIRGEGGVLQSSQREEWAVLITRDDSLDDVINLEGVWQLA